MAKVHYIKKEGNSYKNNKFVTPIITTAKHIKGLSLCITFSDNTIKTIDFTNYLKKNPLFIKFIKVSNFKKFKVDNGDIYWPGNVLDFHHSQLYNWHH